MDMMLLLDHVETLDHVFVGLVDHVGIQNCTWRLMNATSSPLCSAVPTFFPFSKQCLSLCGLRLHPPPSFITIKHRGH